MSIFGSIMSKIFHPMSAAPASAATPDAGGAAAASPAAASPAASSGATGSAGGTAMPEVDVGAVLAEMAAKKGGGGNYQTSIVDLLKLLDLESSLDARKELAGELNVHAGADGTAEQNIALHKAVMRKLAENGGKVPDDMKG